MRMILFSDPMEHLPALRAKLTDLQARFAEEYLVDLNATQAAIRAGCNNSSIGSARVSGHEFLTNPNVQEYIQVLREERSRATKIDAQWLLNRLAAEAQADVQDLYDEFGAVRPIHEWPLIFRQGLVQGIDVEEAYEEVDDPEYPDEGRKRRVAKGRVVKFKLDSRVKRLELIGRHIGVQAFRDTVAHTGVIGVAAVDTRKLSDEQLEVLASLEPAKPE